MRDYYEIMGVSPRATDAEIKRSFRKLALLYHPDKNKTQEAEERFKELNLANEVLGNPSKRAQYDLALTNLRWYSQTVKRQPYSAYRDPAYRNRRPSSTFRQERWTAKALTQMYLPYFRWICRVGMVLTIVVAIDYLLPFTECYEEIIKIERVFRTGRHGGHIYDHHILVTKEGHEITLFADDLSYFENERFIHLRITNWFSKIVSASTSSGDFKIRVALIYGSLSFIPMILFVTSLLGVTIRKQVEFPFNLSIVSFILLLILVYLIIK